jgi:hypothetical protein
MWGISYAILHDIVVNSLDFVEVHDTNFQVTANIISTRPNGEAQKRGLSWKL